LQDRSEEAVRLNVKGRIVTIPRPLVLEVKLVNDFTPLS